MLKEIFDHIPQFSLSKKNAVLDLQGYRWRLQNLQIANILCYRIIPNKRTPPNKRAPPLFLVLCITRKSAGLKKITRHQPAACSRVNMVEPQSA